MIAIVAQKLTGSLGGWVITVTAEHCTLFSPQLLRCCCFRAVDINYISQEQPRTLIFCFHPWPASLLLLNYSDLQLGTSYWGVVDIYRSSWIRHTVLILMNLNCLLLPDIRGHVDCHHWNTFLSVSPISTKFWTFTLCPFLTDPFCLPTIDTKQEQPTARWKDQLLPVSNPADERLHYHLLPHTTGKIWLSVWLLPLTLQKLQPQLRHVFRS